MSSPASSPAADGSGRFQHVEVRLHVPAARERVWSAYMDFPGWTRWAGLGHVSIEREGAPMPTGAGCIRVFRSVGAAAREEILSAESPARMSYRVISGMPIRDHLGEATFDEEAGGTLITWRCRFVSRLPGLGPLFRIGIRYVFARTLRRLARHVAS